MGDCCDGNKARVQEDTGGNSDLKKGGGVTGRRMLREGGENNAERLDARTRLPYFEGFSSNSFLRSNWLST
eukprot:4898162-Pleurochrysis_carterae.AAC.2